MEKRRINSLIFTQKMEKQFYLKVSDLNFSISWKVQCTLHCTEYVNLKLPGRYQCNCEARKHQLINNCLTCGRIVCEQEGSGPCYVCGSLVCSEITSEFLNS